MRIAILAFDGFNEIDVFLPFGLLNRLDRQGWRAEITGPSTSIVSMHGVAVAAQQPLDFANEADAVIFAGTAQARLMTDPASELSQARKLLDRLELDPLRQLIAAQSSGSLLLARLGLLGDSPACTDAASRPWLVEAGVRVHDGPFHARGPIATSAGCLSAPYLAAWLMAQGAGFESAGQALQAAAPVGEPDYAERTLAVVRPFIEAPG